MVKIDKPNTFKIFKLLKKNLWSLTFFPPLKKVLIHELLIECIKNEAQLLELNDLFINLNECPREISNFRRNSIIFSRIKILSHQTSGKAFFSS